MKIVTAQTVSSGAVIILTCSYLAKVFNEMSPTKYFAEGAEMSFNEVWEFLGGTIVSDATTGEIVYRDADDSIVDL
jgi:hypothetical protein